MCVFLFCSLCNDDDDDDDGDDDYDDVFQDSSAIFELLRRNTNFIPLKPRILAFHLGSQFQTSRIPAELWTMISFEFVLPLCFLH